MVPTLVRSPDERPSFLGRDIRDRRSRMSPSRVKNAIWLMRATRSESLDLMPVMVTLSHNCSKRFGLSEDFKALIAKAASGASLTRAEPAIGFHAMVSGEAA